MRHPVDVLKAVLPHRRISCLSGRHVISAYYFQGACVFGAFWFELVEEQVFSLKGLPRM